MGAYSLGSNQSIALANGPDTVNALAGDDLVSLGAGDATVYGATGDTVSSGAGTVAIVAVSTTPVDLIQDAGTIFIYDGGDDTLTAGSAPAQFIAETGDDITLGSGPDTVNALAGNESVALGNGNATVYGATGDTITSALGTGVVFAEGGGIVVVDATSGSILAFADPNDTLSSGSASVRFLAGVGDSISLGSGADTVNALAGDATIELGSGDDYVFGESGDIITSSTGTVATINSAANPVVFAQTTGVMLINDGSGDTISSGAVAAQIIGAASDNITLGTGNATVNALAGDEAVMLGPGITTTFTESGISGPEIVSTNTGNDTVYGAAGDTISSQSGTVVVFDAGSAPIVDIDEGSDPEATQEIITSGAGDTLTGGNVGAQFIGAAGDDIILGSGIAQVSALAGNEMITLGTNTDYVYATTGDTIGTGAGIAVIVNGSLNINDPNNWINVTGGGPVVHVDLAANATVTGGAASTYFQTSGNDQVTLGVAEDTVEIFGPSNTVALGSGQSTVLCAPNSSGTMIDGGGSGSISFSSAPNLTFVDAANTYYDTIMGFSQPNGDRIHLTTDTVSYALAHSQQVNGGQDTEIALSDGSIILLKGISNIDGSIFS